MNLIKGDPREYYRLTLEALEWVSYDLYMDKVVDALKEQLENKTPNPDFWNIHVALCYLAKTLNPQSYLEIGTRRGRSLFQVLCHADVKKAVSIDLFTESHFLDLKADVDRFLRQTKKKIEVIYYKEDSRTALPKIKDQFDLITIDASHYFETAVKDLAAAHEMLKTQGVIVVDDIAQMPHLMKMVTDFLASHQEFKLIHTDQLFGCAVLYRGLDL